jgi:prepilin-type N-terminal cleavage/methylation domain-containing protein
MKMSWSSGAGPGRQRRSYGQRGYSLVEFVAALSLVAILMTLAVFQIRQALAREQLDDWVRTVANDIEFGRQSAVTRRITVTITLTATSYAVATSGGITLSRENLPPDIALSASCGGTSCSSFSFNRRGLPITAQSPPPPPPPDRVTLTSASTGQSYVVTVQSLTGRVSYQ